MSLRNISEQLTGAIFLELPESEKRQTLFRSPFKVLPDIRESCSETLDSQDEIDKILLMTCDGNVDYALKVERLQKTFNFLQERYKTLLTSLHEEVEELRKKNKELSFKLAMLVGQKQNSMIMKSERKLSSMQNGSKIQSKDYQPPSVQADFRRHQLEEEMKELKELLTNYKEKNERLQQKVDELGILKERVNAPPEITTASQDKAKDDGQSVIKHLNDINQFQIEEIRKIQTDLFGVLDSDNVSLNAFLMAKGYKDGRKDICSDLRGSAFSKNPKNNMTSSPAPLENQFLPPLRSSLSYGRQGSKSSAIRGKPKFRP